MSVIEKVRYKHMDIAKGICMLFVLMAHSCGFPFGMAMYCTAFFMSLFFVLAGYNFEGNYTWSTYVLKRSKKILIPYFKYNIALVVIWGLWKGFASVKEFILTIVGVIYSSYCLYYPVDAEPNIYFYRVANEATWFLTAFFCASILFYGYVRFCDGTVKKILFLFWGVLLTKWLVDFPLFLPWNADRAIIGTMLMVVGYEMKKYLIFQTGNKIIKIISTPVLIFVYKVMADANPWINLSTRAYGNAEKGSIVLFLLIGIVGTIICVWISEILEYIPMVNDVLAVMGRKSLPILGMHLILFRIFDIYVASNIIIQNNALMFWVVSFGRIAVTVLIIILADYLCRRLIVKERKSLDKE